MNSELSLAKTSDAPQPIVVVEVPRPLGPWTRYEDQIFADVPEDFEVRFIGGSTSLEDVDLIHTSDSLDRMMKVDRKASSRARLSKTKDFVEALAVHKVKLVRTTHASRPEFKDEYEREASELLDAHTALFISIDSSTAAGEECRSKVIPYADMADRFVGYPTRAREAGRIVAIAPEGEEVAACGLVKTIAFSRTKGLSLRIAGESTTALQATVENHNAANQISWRRENLSDAAYIEEVTAAEIVFPPDPRTLYGYHLMMLSLTYKRPVVIPKCPMATSLANHVGHDWVITYQGPITAAVIDDAAERAALTRGQPAPRMSGRSLSEISTLYFKTFRELLDNRDFCDKDEVR